MTWNGSAASTRGSPMSSEGPYARLQHACGRVGEVAVGASYDVVVAYGLLHCFPSSREAMAVAKKVAANVRPGGILILSSLTVGIHADAAHPELQSCHFPTAEEL